jgi:NodT family efflux transporter outer membrane factor (OMF) lipoprotein
VTLPRQIAFVASGLAASAALLLTGCSVGPKYVKPASEAPAAYKETPENFKVAQPNDAIARGKWWEVYNDSQLNQLEEQISVSNQSLKSAEAQFREARAAVRISRSALFPTVGVTPGASHTTQSENQPLFRKGSEDRSYNDFIIPFDFSYELDLWGRVHKTIEASRSEAQATAADLANVNLSLHAELAMDYFQMRGLDAEAQLLNSTVDSYQKAVDLTNSRFKAGIASAVDLAQAQTTLETTRAQAVDVQVDRANFEHAIAVLIGKPASSFHIDPLPLDLLPPATPPGLPSDLLERRPDISAAERRVQEANANVGVARTAYYPLVTLSGTGGFESAVFTTLLQGPSGLWSLGGQAAQTIFDGGQRRGTNEQARAAYDKSVSDYRESILVAFQEVEDNLSTLRVLDDEATKEDAAVAAAQHSVQLSVTRYKGGVTNYLEVTTAESQSLADQVTAVNIRTRRMTASVLLIKAIGGGWSTSQLPPV